MDDPEHVRLRQHADRDERLAQEQADVACLKIEAAPSEHFRNASLCSLPHWHGAMAVH
jgi:hypothetical protein